MTGAVLRSAVAFIGIGATAAAFAISCAAIVYLGALDPYLGPGIGLALPCTIMMGLAGVALFSCRGLAAAERDNDPAGRCCLLAGAVGALIAGREPPGVDAFRTTVTALAIILTAPLATGALTYLAGRLRAGRGWPGWLIPYPVTGVFLAASGDMLLAGALSMTLDTDMSVEALHAVAAPERLGDRLPRAARRLGRSTRPLRHAVLWPLSPPCRAARRVRRGARAAAVPRGVPSAGGTRYARRSDRKCRWVRTRGRW